MAAGACASACAILVFGWHRCVDAGIYYIQIKIKNKK